MYLDVIPDITMHGQGDPHQRTISRRPPTVGRLAALVHDHTVRPADWWHLVGFDPAAPVRVPLDRGEGIELWLTTWPPGHRTERRDHDHDSGADSGDVVTLIAGELTEITVTQHGATERWLPVGRVRVHGGRDLYELANPGPGYAVTLHAAPYAAGS